MEGLGQNIRNARLGMGCSQQELAAMVQISPGFLSQIEKGKNFPSLATLKKLSISLKQSISQLLGEEPAAPDARMLVRANERKRLANLGDGGLEIQFLSEFDVQNDMEICVHNLKPQAKSGVDSYSHDGQEIFYVLGGTIDLSVDGVVYTMREGDCFYLKDCSQQHFFTNPSAAQNASMMCVVVPPFFYTRAKSEPS